MSHEIRPSRPFVIAAIIVLLAAAVPWPRPSAAAELAEFTATYRVMVGSSELGELQATLERDGDRYTLTATTRPNTVARLFGGDELTETNVFRIDGDTVRTLDYRVTKGRKGRLEEQAQFDWESGLVRLGGVATELPVDGIVEAGVFPVSLMVGGGRGVAGRNAYLVDGDKVRRYRYLAPREENVEIAGGAVHAVRIEKQRVDREDRSIVVWLQPGRGHLPVRIEQRRKDRTTVLVLTGSSLPG